MKKKSSPRSAFFIFRISAALCLLLSSIFLALLGSGAFSSSVLAGAKASSAPAESTATDAAKDVEEFSPADQNGRFRYLIEFAEPGLLNRTGTPKDQRFDPNRPEVQAQRALLVAEQAAHVQAMNSAVGRTLDVTHHFVATHSGVATRLTPAEADSVRNVPGVKSVERERVYEPDTYRGPTFIGADKIWDGTAVPGGVGTTGSGHRHRHARYGRRLDPSVICQRCSLRPRPGGRAEQADQFSGLFQH